MEFKVVGGGEKVWGGAIITYGYAIAIKENSILFPNRIVHVNVLYNGFY